ncbi:MAG: toll/interleukin-1 receptor domain-containing protein [Geminicoccaceae bacterium]|nr:toll/interleukin-1 receptor domain-containing protein [Geminicoccaceae bacterium]
MTSPLKVFLSYAHEDEADGGWKSMAVTMLSSLARDGIVEIFEDGMLDVTADWDDSIRENLQSADLAIFLVSPGFNASPYISTIEVALACDRRDRGEMFIMPIIVRDCDWQYKRWAKIDALPKMAGSVKPLEEWERPHQALGEVSKRIRELQRSWSDRPAAPASHPDLGPPYRGLLMFEREHVDDFFGRERLADQLWERIREHPVVLLSGPSGSGKSSLIRAGIEPRIWSEGDWAISRFTPRNQPMVEWAKSLIGILEPTTPRLDIPERARVIAERLIATPERLVEHIRNFHETTGKRLFFFIDQLEDSFSLARHECPEQHRALIRALLLMARSHADVPFRTVLAFRSDFLTALIEDDPEFVDAIQGCEIRARRMTPDELTRAILAPAARRGVEIDVAVAARIIADIEANPDALPLVGVALDALWRQRRRDQISYEELEAIGGVAGALAKQADQALADSGVDELAARRLFLSLAHIGPASGVAHHATRRPRRRSELGEELWQVAQSLGASRLITIDSGLPGDPVVDISHESLFRRWPRLSEWIEIHANDMLLIQKIEARRLEWLENDRHDDFIWPASNVEAAIELMTRDMLTAEQRQFIDASIAIQSARAADMACMAHWLSLELSWFGGCPEPHELATLRTLTAARTSHRAAMLRAAVCNTDRSRKFQREPGVMLRVLGGLHREGAIQLLDILDNLVTTTSDIRCLAKSRLVLAGWSAPFDTRMIAPAMVMLTDLIQQSDTPANLTASATALDALSGHVPAEEISAPAARVIEGTVTHYLDGNGANLVGELGPATARLATRVDQADADRLARRLLDGFGRSPPLAASQTMVPVLRALCRRLSSGQADSFASRLISAVGRSPSPTRLHAIVEIADSLVDAMSETACNHVLNRLVAMIDREQEPAQRLAIVQMLASLARRAPFSGHKDEAARLIAELEEGLGSMRDPDEIRTLALTTAILCGELQVQARHEFLHAIVDKALAAAGRVDFLPTQQSAADTIHAVATLIDRDFAADVAERSEAFIRSATSPVALQAWSVTLGALLRRCHEKDMRHRTRNIRELIHQYDEDIDALAAACYVIDAIAGADRSQETVELLDFVTERLLRAAFEAGDTGTLAVASEALCRISPHLGKPVFLHAALLILRHPLSGDESVTSYLVEAIAGTLHLTLEPGSSYYARYWQAMGALEGEDGLDHALLFGLPTAQSVEAAISGFRRQKSRHARESAGSSETAVRNELPMSPHR